MPQFHRKTAPGVRDGRVRKKNNWKKTPNCYNTPQSTPVIDRERPGSGYRHIVKPRDIERFISLIPDWQDLSRGLNVILLGRGRSGRDGWYNSSGVIGLCAWPVEMVSSLDGDWFSAHHDLLTRLGVETWTDEEGEPVCRWTPSSVRAYLLLHVFLHELGHHRDRMTTRSRRECSRGEPYAEQVAWDFEELIWERYCDEFGMPG